MKSVGGAVFLDRDGVLVDELGYLTRVEDLRLLPGAREAVRAIRAAGYRVVVASNQSAVARGMLTLEGLEVIHARLHALMREAGAELDGVYVCPHHPEGLVPELAIVCECRKPAPGLLRRAAGELGLPLDSRSLFVGDQWSDIQCARAAGVRAVLVRTGKGASVEARVRREFPEVSVCDSIADIPALLATLEENR